MGLHPETVAVFMPWMQLPGNDFVLLMSGALVLTKEQQKLSPLDTIGKDTAHEQTTTCCNKRIAALENKKNKKLRRCNRTKEQQKLSPLDTIGKDNAHEQTTTCCNKRIAALEREREREREREK
ncbi:hypothetical protein Q3G72_024423 [Acer saccharum]|nr:hypothetical protein Q3G72_024423 [Acer saccharum]